MIITKVTLSYDDGSTHDFMSMDDASAHAAAHVDTLAGDQSTAPAPAEDHAAPAQDSAPAASEAEAPAQDAQQSL